MVCGRNKPISAKTENGRSFYLSIHKTVLFCVVCANPDAKIAGG